MSSPSSFASSFASSFGSSFTSLMEPEPEPPLPKQPLPISTEYDMIAQNYFSKVKVDRSDWLERALKESPEIAEYRERVNPVARAAKFGRLYLPSNRFLSQQTLLSLISHHLRTLGLVETQSSLHSEWEGTLDTPAHLLRSQLTFLVQRGIYRAERFWELTQGSPNLTPEERKDALDEEISRTIGGAPTIEDEKPTEGASAEEYVLDPKTGHLLNATLNQLILMLTTKSFAKNVEGIENAFLLTYKSVVSSQVLFSKLRERFRNCHKTHDNEGMQMTFELFQHWLKKAGKEIEQPILEAMKAFAEKELKPIYPRQCATMFDQTTEKNRMIISEVGAPKVQLGNCITTLWTGTFKLTDLPFVELARQMTIWTIRHYYIVQRSEFLDGAWQNMRLKHRAPNLVAIIDHQNLIRSWVSSCIITTQKFDERMKVWNYMIDLMHELWELHNYNDAFAVLGGFETSEMFRLTAHRACLPKKQRDFLDEVKKVFSDGGSTHKFIREKHEQALQAGKPAVPFFGILLSDLFKYGDIEKSRTPDGKINITKCVKMYKFIKAIEVYKKQKYVFLPIEQVQSKLDNLPVVDPAALYAVSLEIEPKGATEQTLREMNK